MGVGVVMSARIHWPRASQSGLMHCTVKPGKYCIESPSEAAKLRPIHARRGRCRAKKPELPWLAKPRSMLCLDSGPGRFRCKSKVRQGRAGTKQLMGRILARECCGVKRKDYKILW